MQAVRWKEVSKEDSTTDLQKMIGRTVAKDLIEAMDPLYEYVEASTILWSGVGN